MSAASLTDFVEPALALDGYATIRDALPSLMEGKPAWVVHDDRWSAVLPHHAVGHAPGRRVVDLPLVELRPIGADATVADVLTRDHAGGYVPVVDSHRLLGHVAVARVERSARVIRADLAAAIAHDLNNSLCALAAILDESEGGPEHSAVQHTTRIAERLFTLARDTVHKPEPLHVGDLVRELASWLGPTVTPVKLVVRVGPGLPVALAYRAALERLLVNLVMNAKDAIAMKGSIHIEVEASEGAVLVTVWDDGPGIPQSVINRVFESGATTKVDHSGIGLASARAAAQRMDARLELVSTGPEGTRFELRLEAVTQK